MMIQINKNSARIGPSNMKIRCLIVFSFLCFTAFSGCQEDYGATAKPINQHHEDTSDNNVPSYVSKILDAAWDSTWVSDAVLWKYYHFSDLFKSRESVTVFDINLNNKDLTIAFPYVTTGEFL